MPLFSDLSSLNMYYSGSSPSSTTYNPYTTATASPIGASYSSSYLSSGGNYSNHSSLSGYSRAPLAPRWVPTGRTYSPLLSTISERGTSSPVRVNSPRRLPISSQYSPANYVPRPININTADIDVSRERYRSRPVTSTSYTPSSDVTKYSSYTAPKEDVPKYSAPIEDPPKPTDAPPVLPMDEGPFMPRIDGKTGSGDDNSPGLQRSTIRRGRTVVRLHTLKRKERDSPRKAQEELDNNDATAAQSKATSRDDSTEGLTGSNKSSPKGSGWREKLSEDLVYKDKRERKTPGEKLIEKFILKDKSDDEGQISRKNSPNSEIVVDSLSSPQKEEKLLPNEAEVKPLVGNKSPDRRCSMELLAEQANVLDTLIREENLSTTCIDLSKIGTQETNSSKGQTVYGSSKKRKSLKNSENRLQTTQSDYSLHERVKSLGLHREQKIFPKKSSLKKSVSGGNICRLDSIVELSKEPLHIELASIDENRVSLKVDTLPSKLKQKTKITSTVEVSQTQSPLKVRVGNVTVEQKLREPRKEINFSSVIDEKEIQVQPEVDRHPEKDCTEDPNIMDENQIKKSKSIRRLSPSLPDSDEIEGDDCNFWDKIGKRETIYLKKRREKLEDELVQSRRAIYWFPEEEDESGANEDIEKTNKVNAVKTSDSNNLVLEPEFGQVEAENKNLPKTKFEIKIQSTDVKSNTAIVSTVKTAKKATMDFTADATEENKEFTKVEQDSSNIKTVKNDSFCSSSKRVEDSTEKSKEIIKNQEVPLESSLIESFLIDEKKNKTRDLVEKSCTKNDDIVSASEHLLSPACDKKNYQLEALSDVSFDQSKSLLNEKSQSIIIEPLNKTKSKNKTEPVMLKDSSDSRKSSSVCICDDFIVKSSDDLKTTPIEESIKMDASNIIDIPVPKTSTSEDSVKISSDKLNVNREENNSQKEDNEKTSTKNVIKLPTSPMRKPLKDEPMVRPLIATPRPLQKRAPQVIHSSSSSESSSDDDSDDDEADESSDSEGSTEFYECENTAQDGRTSTGSNDSGFDSSAPTSPAGFVCVKKDCDVNCHRKCEKLTANLCGVNQRLLVEALATRTASRRGGDDAGASTSTTQPNSLAADSVEAALEASTAYGVFRRTGHVTPPAKSIPRFRKYTIEDFHFLKVLGKGSFGKVLLAELRDTEYYYAVKCLKKDVVLEDDDVECTLIERKVLALGTNHPYLCHLFATFQTDSHLFFVMEYLNGGDLMFHIQQSGRFPEPRAKFYAAEIVSGLKFLHKRGIVYRDLKLDNILLDYEGHVRIADFGMCKLQIYLEKTADTFCGTPDYMAPEIIKGLKYNQTVDWWSFGVLLYEMLIGQSPFSGCDEDELFWSICNELPSYPRFLSQEAHTILVRLLDKDARTRLGGTDCMHGDVRDQDFFHSIHWDRLDRRELESPFRPRVRHPYDTQYFDRAFTGERPRLTAVEPNVLRTMDQQPFRGFSYTNPNATDR